VSKIDKLRAQERSERLLGNCSLADNLLAKIASMENKGLVPVHKVDDSDAVRRREVETAWSAIAPETIVDVLCCVPGVARKVRRTMIMAEAIHELKNGGWLVGRTADLAYPPPMTTENTPALSTGRGTGICYL